MSLKPYFRDRPEMIVEIKRFQSTAPVDVVRLAEALGISVFEDQLPIGISGKIFRDVEQGGLAQYSIIVNEDDPETRRRFTIAHEIAHFLLHKRHIGDGEGIIDDSLFRSNLSDSIEREANRLAAEILMPPGLLDEALQGGDKSQRSIAQELGVSETALKIRLGIPT